MKIEFPAIIYLDGGFVVDNSDWYRAVGAKFANDTQFSISENLKRKSKSGWIIDHSGKYIELHPAGKEREILRPLSFLVWNWVRSTYTATAPRSVTVGEVMTSVNGFSAEQSRRDLVKDFRQFLSNEDQNDIVTRNMLDRWPI